MFSRKSQVNGNLRDAIATSLGRPKNKGDQEY
jgi:hypothetical protein